MNRFIVILTDMESGVVDYVHPQEIFAPDKNKAKEYMLENIPPESIAGIYSEAEYRSVMKAKGKPIIDFGPSPSMPAPEIPSQIQEQSTQNLVQIVQNQNCDTTTVKQILPPKFFTDPDSGIEFKVEQDGKVYKKTWVTVFNPVKSITKTSESEFRLVNANTEKVVNTNKYAIQELQWILVS